MFLGDLISTIEYFQIGLSNVRHNNGVWFIFLAANSNGEIP